MYTESLRCVLRDVIKARGCKDPVVIAFNQFSEIQQKEKLNEVIWKIRETHPVDIESHIRNAIDSVFIEE